MLLSELLADCLLLDLEARGDRIYRIGAVWREARFERKGRFDLPAAISQLDYFGRDARYVLGHNLIDHDIPILYRAFPSVDLLCKPVVDTLYLSPLAFPENPYHRLVKDYKLVRESVSDPVADAMLAGSVFEDQWKSFEEMRAEGRGDELSLYRFCFEEGISRSIHGEGSPGRGLVEVFEALGAASLHRSRAEDILRILLRGRACTGALRDLHEAVAGDRERRIAIAYCTAWLQVAGMSSVVPPWVRLRFPALVDVLRRWRDVPCNDEGCEYCRTIHDPEIQLRRHFGLSSFRSAPAEPATGRSLQELVVRNGMADRSLLAILPTGGGKSLCYQLPALVRHVRRGTLTIVISPLQALMKDQVDNLIARTGIFAVAAINGLLTPPERGEALERVRLGDVAILYVSPEQLRNRSFRRTIAQREIGCWVFDEAHCLSKWGHDFRPDFLYAGRFIREFAEGQNVSVPPVACFTATAKRDVKQEIIEFFQRELGQSLVVFEGSVERENLRFEVRMVSRAGKYARIHEILGERLPASGGSAVVYVAMRKEAEGLAEYLERQGLSVAAFHAGLSAPEKRMVQELFIRGEIKVICATNAFGMGIDKEDVRLVVHADIPGSLENYLQEAGRAGRDLMDAECILLYDEQDVETQFKLEALSELHQRDIAEILRSLRRARRRESGEVVITSGELLRDEEVDTTFDMEDRMADTKVKTAVAWLERAGFLERNENDTRVFQGKPLVSSLTEAGEQISKLGLSVTQRKRWLAIMTALINADVDKGLNADSLAELPEMKEKGDGTGISPSSRVESDTQRVLRTLHNMAEAGLIKMGVQLSAFVRYKVVNASPMIFKRVCALEEAMLRLMRESAPDAAEKGWLDLSLRRLSQQLKNDGFEDGNPQTLLSLLKSLSLDGRGLAGKRGSLELRHAFQDCYRVRLHRDWNALVETAKKRRAVANTALEAIFFKVPQEASPSAALLVGFSSEDIVQALKRNINLAGQIKDPLAAVDRGLMFLHEQRVIILQQGLAVFRQAMTIRVMPQSGRRGYTKGDYEPLQWHYRERVLQIHIMNEYARLGLEKIRQALELVLAYFSMDKIAFLKRFFPERREILECATGQASYRRIVENLRNRVQREVVGAPEERNMLILAGPGSGKTHAVVHRCAWLLRVKRVPARSILIICFNRSAAMALRRRLNELVGGDARAVVVQTYHGLAMRLTGTSFAAMMEKGGGENLPFDQVIPDAISLLEGGKEILGLEPDELRDRLLAGYRHILVDEYQDIDLNQYRLISAIVGRTEKDHDRRLSILAVGDDDQNIYAFRGANVELIRRFKEDYRARVYHLVENYRSTAHIIAAANQLIGNNQDRMKTLYAVRIDEQRVKEPPGGQWASLDPVARGRVQMIDVASASEQARAIVAELKRLHSLKPSPDWSGYAVLARTRDVLSPVRILCERFGIPVTWGLSGSKAPALHRVREIARFIDELKIDREALLSASDLQGMLTKLSSCAPGENPWWEYLLEVLGSWADETGDARLPVTHAIEYIFETLAEQRRERSIGRGVFLSTVHGAKGLQFPHVFIADGGWYPGREPKEQEEERRLFYVGMTRAGETLSLFRRIDGKNPHLGLLNGDFILQRQGDTKNGLSENHGAMPDDEGLLHLERSRFALLGMKDIFLDFAARYRSRDAIHRHLAALGPGSRLTLARTGERIELLDDHGVAVAMLSLKASQLWLPRLDSVDGARVVAMIRRERKDTGEEYRQSCRCERWEAPWVEVRYNANGCKPLCFDCPAP